MLPLSGVVTATLFIRRVAARSDGVFGVALWQEFDFDQPMPFAVTGEDAWRNNLPNNSCIPAGRYRATRYQSPKRGYEVWLLHDVPGRSMIEIHIGNSADDVAGCIYVGSSFEASLDEKCGVGGSRAAFARLMVLTATLDEIIVQIEDCWGGTTQMVH